MTVSEVFALFISVILAFIFLVRWYMFVLNAGQYKKLGAVKACLALLPLLCVAVLITVLKLWADYYVRTNAFFIIYYSIMGFAWLCIGMLLMSALFDLSWIDDVLNLYNKAAFFAVCGCAIGLTFIYSGANIGDGPGWWCVIFAGGLGALVWGGIMALLNRTSNIFERITVERDYACGIRFFFYLISLGLLLGRASAGDWISFSQTVLDFKDGWPVLPLTLLFILIEHYYITVQKNETGETHNGVLGSVFFGFIYVAVAVLSIVYVLPALSNNPFYDKLAWGNFSQFYDKLAEGTISKVCGIAFAPLNGAWVA